MENEALLPARSHVSGNVERVLAWTALLYGLTILNPWTEVFKSYHAYDAMARQGPELLWGLVMTSVGLSQLTALKLDHRLARITTAFLAGGLWGGMAWLFFLGRLVGPSARQILDAATSPGVFLFLLWGFSQARTAFRLKE